DRVLLRGAAVEPGRRRRDLRSGGADAAVRARHRALLGLAALPLTRAAVAAPRRSEHAVAVRRLGGNDLQHVPVLDDLAVAVDAEDVDPGVVVVARPALVAVQDDEVCLGDGPLELGAL